MFGTTTTADDAAEAVRQDPAAEVAPDLLVDVLGQAGAVGARGGKSGADTVDLRSDHAVEEPPLGLSAAVRRAAERWAWGQGRHGPPALRCACRAGSPSVAVAARVRPSEIRPDASGRRPRACG